MSVDCSYPGTRKQKDRGESGENSGEGGEGRDSRSMGIDRNLESPIGDR